jgi:hypothetical protein
MYCEISRGAYDFPILTPNRHPHHLPSDRYSPSHDPPNPTTSCAPYYTSNHSQLFSTYHNSSPLRTIMYPTMHSIRTAQAPLYTSPASPPIAPPSFVLRMHRLSGSNMTPTPQQTHATLASAPATSPAPAAPIEPASAFPQDLPQRPAPASTWVRINTAHYIFPRPTVAARPVDMEMGSMSQRRSVSGASGQENRSGRWSKRTATKVVVVLAIVAVFWIFIIVGIVLGSKRRVAGSPGI